MSSNNQTVVLVLLGVGVGIGLWLLLKEDRRRREGFNGPRLRDFERGYLLPTDAGSGRYKRSLSNYVGDVTKSPHYQANPVDEGLPLEMANLAMGQMQLIPPYVPMLTGGQYTPGPNDFVPTLPDDLPTRMSNTESGNQVFSDWLGSSRIDGVVGDYPTKFSISQTML